MDAQVNGAGPVLERVRVGDIWVHRTTLTETTNRLIKAVQERRAHQVVTVNLQFLSLAERNPTFAAVVNRAHLVVPDGMPVVWISKALGRPLPGRITGHDLLSVAARLSAERGYSLFFLGPSPEVAAESRARLEEMYPGVRVVGSYAGQFTLDGYGATERDEVGAVEAIRAANPDFLFVALGCPKQDYWIAHHLDEVNVPVAIGVGGIFEVLAGRVDRAPLWMQRWGLEWAHRLAQEPTRLWRRYLLEAGPTVFRLSASTIVRRVRGAASVR